MKHLTLRQARKARGWTQQELADRCGIKQAQISALETRVGDPQHSTAQLLEKTLGVPYGTLIFGEPMEAAS